MLKIRSLSQILLMVTGLFYLADTATGGLLSRFMLLDSTRLIGNVELWRLVTYPLASGDFLEFVAFGLATFLLGEHIEERLGSRNYGLWLLSMTVVQGVVFYFLFRNTGFTLQGAGSLTMMTVSASLWLIPHRAISLYGFKTVPAAYVSYGVTLLVFLSVGLGLVFRDVAHFSRAVLEAAFGIATGLAACFPFMVRRGGRSSEISEVRSVRRMIVNDPEPEPVESSMFGGHSFASNKSSFTEEIVQSDEDRLNEILEKIHAKGKQSLRADEVDFLHKYSKRI